MLPALSALTLSLGPTSVIGKDGFVPVDMPLTTAQRHGSRAGRAILHSPGVSLPGVGGLSHGCLRRVVQQTPTVTMRIDPESEERTEEAPVTILTP